MYLLILYPYFTPSLSPLVTTKTFSFNKAIIFRHFKGLSHFSFQINMKNVQTQPEKRLDFLWSCFKEGEKCHWDSNLGIGGSGASKLKKKTKMVSQFSSKSDKFCSQIRQKPNQTNKPPRPTKQNKPPNNNNKRLP